MDLIRPAEFKRVIDLGCGTGELTQLLHQRLRSEVTWGLDSSAKMLEASKKFQTENLNFQLNDIGSFTATEKFDLVFSNAALQWLPGHEELLPRILSWIKPGGQIAVQMPFNHDHASHRLAREIAIQRFPHLFTAANTGPHVLPLERYSELLFRHGFVEQNCSIKIYDHPMSSSQEVVEWTKGTTLTAYQNKLSPAEFEQFLSEYSEKLLNEIGRGSYFYTFKRLLFWGILAPQSVE